MFMVWRTDRKLQARIDAIRAAGDPATIADLAPEPIPADQNAAAYLEKIAPRLDEFAKEHGRFFNTPIGNAYSESRDRGEPPTPEQIVAIRAIVDKYPDLDEGIAAAAACTQYASVTDFSVGHQQFLEEGLDNRVQRIRTAARFASWRMEVLGNDGQTDAAVRLGIELLQLARLYNDEPLLVNYLVGIAVRSIAAQSIYDAQANGIISPETLAALDQELALQDDPQQLVRVLITEQAFCISGASEGFVMKSEGISPVWIKLVGWPIKSMFVNSLGVFDEQFELAPRPWYEIRDRFNANGSFSVSGHGVMGELLAPALGAACIAHARNLAVMRSLRIASALAEYRQQHSCEASGLADLNLPKESTIDPFSGEPLKLKHTDGGWVIYSVMQNGVDDGGEFKDAKDYGLAPRKWRTME